MSRAIAPASTPQQTRAGVLARLGAAGIALDRTKHPLLIVGVRGYYRDTMGVKGANDRGIFDDAIFLDSPNAFVSYNGNTDPTSFRAATKARRGMATLTPGLWFAHKFGLHKGKPALVQQMAPVTVARDGETALHTGWFGINIHRAPNTGTSSEGCQTIPGTQWFSFLATAEMEARRYFGAKWDQVAIPYALVVEPGA